MGLSRRGLPAQLLLVGAALEVRRAPAAPRAGEPAAVHFVYTVGCNDYQLVQGVVLDHSWREVGTRGRLTRIVEGCSTEAERQLLATSPLRGSPVYAVFFAEGDLEVIPRRGERYPARARPHAIAQWLDAAEPDESVVALLDPDFLLLRPLSQHPSLSSARRGRILSSSGWWDKWDGTNLVCHRRLRKASLATPMGNKTGFGCSYQPGPIWNVTMEDEYRTGPIWFFHVEDLKTLLPDWMHFTDRWPKLGNGLMREQYALWRAAKRHKIPADFEPSLATELLGSNASEDPYSLHYYRSYGYGAWDFHKSLASSGWYAQDFDNSLPAPLTCGAPLLQEPPEPPRGEREARTIAELVRKLNGAVREYREEYCPGEAAAFLHAGPRAFGLARLMLPAPCGGEEATGRATRYRVERSAPADWHSSPALGGGRCTVEAQAAQAAVD